MVDTKQIYFSPTFLKSWVHISNNVAGVVGDKTVLLEGMQVKGRRKGSFSLYNDYLDDVFTLKDLLGLNTLSSLTYFKFLILHENTNRQ